MVNHVSFAECEQALDHINRAPLDEAEIDCLCARPDFGTRAFPDKLILTVDHGILGERWTHSPWLTLPNGDPDPRIQVSILSKRVMDLCWRDRERVIHPGDPFVVDMNLGEANMPVGTRLAIGTAIVEVSDKFNTACVKWRDRYGQDSLHWMNLARNRPYRLRGILCRIVQDGEVKLGDRLAKLPNSAEPT